MAFLTLPTVGDVPVDLDDGSAEMEWDEVGERSRAFDGTMHVTVRDWKRRWRVRLVRVVRASGDSIVSALQGTPPLACSGDLLGGAVNCIPELVRARHPKHADGEYQILEFILHEQ